MKTLNLALQGGGSHGAFTWGVLDALLADPRIGFEGLSGTSAGAVNAVALASGWAKALAAGQDPRAGARESLARLWGEVAQWGTLGSLQARFAGLMWGTGRVAGALPASPDPAHASATAATAATAATTGPVAASDARGPVDPVLARRLNGALNRVLGKDRADRGWEPVVGAVVVQSVAQAPPGFDARFSALSRAYRYRVADARTGHDPLTRTFSWWVDPQLDVAAMDSAVRELLGLHNFLSYCKPRAGATTVRELQRATVDRDEHGMITVALTADAFCHHMVRSVVGALVRVGEGRHGPSWPGERLRARTRDAAIVMAPAHGLVLDAVAYPDDALLAERARVTRARRGGD